MPVFRWQGVSPRGEMLSGEMEAPSRDAVLVRLRSQRIQPLPDKVKEKGRGLDREITIPGFSDSITGRDIFEIARMALPFFLILVLATVILTLFPEIALWLPNTMLAR